MNGKKVGKTFYFARTCTRHVEDTRTNLCQKCGCRQSCLFGCSPLAVGEGTHVTDTAPVTVFVCGLVSENVVSL